MRHGDQYGLPSVEPEIDTSLVWKRIRAIQQDIASTDDNPERFEAMGVEIVFGTARLTGPNTVVVTSPDGECTRARDPLRAAVHRQPAGHPAIDGLREAGFLTSENSSRSNGPPGSMVMIGGGPIAIEMAQGFTRLGIATTVLQKGPGILPRDEPDAGRDPHRRAARRGRRPPPERRHRAGRRIEDGRKIVHGSEDGEPARWEAEELLVAVGRRPNVEGLGLEEIGVEVGPRGVEVDERMRTAVPSDLRRGDMAGRYLFTHSAGYEAVRAVRDMFFPGKGKVDRLRAVVHVHRPRAGPRRADDGRGRGAARRRRRGLAHGPGPLRPGPGRRRHRGAPSWWSRRRQGGRRPHPRPAAGEMIHELALAINEGLKLAERGRPHPRLPDAVDRHRPAGGRGRLRGGQAAPLAGAQGEVAGSGSRPLAPEKVSRPCPCPYRCWRCLCWGSCGAGDVAWMPAPVAGWV